MSAITDRILRQLGDANLLEKLLSLPNSDLNSLLLELYKRQSREITPVGVLKAYANNRFSAASEANPARYHALEADFLTMAQAMDIKAILLSPVEPLGSCSAFGCVDQNNVISAVRGTEILSDPSNMLAIIIADRLKRNQLDNISPAHYCTTARVVRAQVFSKGSYSHFGLFSIVSSGKSRGSYACETELLTKQLAYYKKFFMENYKAKLSVVLSKRKGYTDNEGFFTRMIELIERELMDIPVSIDYSRIDNNYYKGLNFKMYMEKQCKKIEIGDGGFVDWIRQMTGSKKEICFISGIGMDRLLL